ncbi:MAG: hypothetical protein B7Z66_10625 [Chromatiales bacterium 21-64-14]|nr:MAG: hypothetical protein B7Z66_10625 [Chromatiales bacterium 21-64-14]HQU15661.1 ANTAR domain-containing protein [Gammaproteobacteria bacterium]
MRVLLVDEHSQRAGTLEQSLEAAGHTVVGRVAPGEDLLDAIRRLEPDVIIIDIESPDRDTLESMRTISRDRPRPIVMFTGERDSARIREAIQAGVSAYVVDGIAPHRVQPILDAAVARFREFQSMRLERDEARDRLAERKVVERAKGILMKQRGVGEEEAYQLLRKAAMDRNLRVAEVARSVIAAAELLG